MCYDNRPFPSELPHVDGPHALRGLRTDTQQPGRGSRTTIAVRRVATSIFVLRGGVLVHSRAGRRAPQAGAPRGLTSRSQP